MKSLIRGKNPFKSGFLREKSFLAIILLASTLLSAGLAGATTLGGWNLNMEYRDLRPEENFAAAYAYGCQTCSISQFDAIEVAPGFDKRPVRIILFDSARMTQAFPAPPDGTPTGLDLIPGVTDLFGADEEFGLIAKVLSAEPIFTPAGPIGHAQVQRYADLTFSQGTVVHEIINAQDEHFILFTANLSLESTVGGGTIDFRQAGSLGDYVAPYLQTGWSYSSYVLGSDLTVYSEGQASVLGMPGLTWQQYPVASVPPSHAKRIYEGSPFSGEINYSGDNEWVCFYSKSKSKLKFQLEKCTVKGGIRIKIYRKKKKGRSMNKSKITLKKLKPVNTINLKKEGVAKAQKVLKKYWYFGKIISKKKNRTGSYKLEYTKK